MGQEWKSRPWNGAIQTVQCRLDREGPAGLFVGDLVFAPDGPHLVVRWDDTDWGKFALDVVRLEASHLTEDPPGSGHWGYARPIRDPRAFG
jgi:hypothetical protein